MTETITVAQAEVVLADARSRAAVEQRERDIALLATMRANLANARSKFNALASQHLKATEQHDELTRQMDQLAYLISESQQRMPPVADILPLDAEVVAWRVKHTALQSQHDGFATQRRAIVHVDKVAAVQLANDIQQLEWAVQNTLNKLRGSGNKTEGDFLSNGSLSFVA